MPQSDVLSLCLAQQVLVAMQRVLPLPPTCRDTSFVTRCPVLLQGEGPVCSTVLVSHSDRVIMWPNQVTFCLSDPEEQLKIQFERSSQAGAVAQ